jgi:hypothetical protein
MFSILPLQLATNIFIAETPDDVSRYYGFDKVPTQAAASVPESPNFIPPQSSESKPFPEIVDLEVTEDSDRLILTDPPPNLRKIVVCDGIDAIAPIQPGDLCIVRQRPKRPMAFFLPTGARQDAEEFDAVITLLRRS